MPSSGVTEIGGLDTKKTAVALVKLQPTVLRFIFAPQQTLFMVPCICINDEGRPVEIPTDKWVKKDEQYRITHVYFHPKQGIQGCTLYEKPLDESCKPYETFKLSRFAIHHDDLQAFIELCKMCTELNELEIEKLIEESELQTV